MSPTWENSHTCKRPGPQITVKNRYTKIEKSNDQQSITYEELLVKPTMTTSYDIGTQIAFIMPPG
ncbi:MAG: hypothetical protein GY757_57695 [bacterium]|nr:hypothetical protein [bacterium]